MSYGVPRRIVSGGRKLYVREGRHQLTISVPRARRDNVLRAGIWITSARAARAVARAPERKRRQRPAEVTCTNDRRYCGIYAIAFAVHAALGDDVNGEAPRIRPNSNEKSPLAVRFQEKRKKNLCGWANHKLKMQPT